MLSHFLAPPGVQNVALLRRSFVRLALIAVASAAPAANGADLREGAVYLMTNQPVNHIVAFLGQPDGTLRRVGRFATGGKGDPVAQGADPPTDPLASQGSLAMTAD